MNIEPESKELFENMLPYLSQPGPFIDSPIDENFPDAFFSIDFPILVVGAGGLGCQMIKNLALNGFRQIHVIDLDTIDVTNLNRQFLFRKKDVGKYKSEVAAQFVMNRIPHVKVIPYTCRIQEKDKKFYQQFSIIIAGLDNVEARRWLNQLVHDLCEFDQNGQIKPETKHILIDGGTQRFNGQCMIIKPFETSCYQCIIDTLPKQLIFNSCTIAKTPRIPQHCIQYAFQVLWEENFGNKKVDNDNPEDVRWIYQKALQRAENFGIKGVTYMLTLGVIKNIIPAIASTNALIAAVCTSQAFKLTTYTNPSLNNRFGYNGQTFIGSTTLSMQKQENCKICSKKPTAVSISKASTLQDLLDILEAEPFRMKKISILSGDGYLLSSIIQSTLLNLPKSFEQLIAENKVEMGVPIYVTYISEINITRQIVLNLTFL